MLMSIKKALAAHVSILATVSGISIVLSMLQHPFVGLNRRAYTLVHIKVVYFWRILNIHDCGIQLE